MKVDDDSPMCKEVPYDILNVKEAACLFDVFMLRVLHLEKMHSSSSKLLSGYQQELEKFRRPPLHESSSVVAALLKNNPSSRVTQYQEAGCRHVHSDQQTFVKLNGFLKGLNEHIPQAQALVKQLEELVEKVIGLMDADLDLMLEKGLVITFMDENNGDMKQESCSKEPFLAQRQTSDYATIMSGILSMLEKDLQMQELVVSDLRLDVDSECLQTYSQMWSVRPFIDEALIHQALSWAGK